MFKQVTHIVSTLVITVLLAFNVTPVLAAAPDQQPDQTIVDIAIADGRFTTLVAALDAAGLVDTLSGDGPFTVFAPTDDAFVALPEGTVEALLNDIPTLTNILLYHVVSGKVLAADVVELSSANTLLGKPVRIKFDGTTVKVNNAQVIITDIEASNGVIHVVDAVLIPPKGGGKSYQAPAAKNSNRQAYKNRRFPDLQKYYNNGDGRKQYQPGTQYRNYNRHGYQNNRFYEQNRGRNHRGYYNSPQQCYNR